MAGLLVAPVVSADGAPGREPAEVGEVVVVGARAASQPVVESDVVRMRQQDEGSRSRSDARCQASRARRSGGVRSTDARALDVTPRLRPLTLPDCAPDHTAGQLIPEPMRNRCFQWSRCTLALLCVVWLTGCQNLGALLQHDAAESPMAFLSAAADIEEIVHPSRDGVLASEILSQIAAGEYESASNAINRALSNRIDSSTLQFLNGLTYHLMSSTNVASRPLAKQGYLQAIRFDGSNWAAHYFLGVLELELRNYSRAMAHIAEAMLLGSGPETVIADMGVVAYFAGEPEVAAAMFGLLSRRQPQNTSVAWNHAVALAAAGLFQDALEVAAEIGNGTPPPELAEKIDRWRSQYRFLEQRTATPASAGAAGEPRRRASLPAALSPEWAAGGGFGPARFIRAQYEDESGGWSEDGSEGWSDDGGDSYPQTPSERLGRDVKAFLARTSETMVILDVVILQTETVVGETRGVNLLDGLTAQFGFNYEKTRTRDSSDSGVLDGSNRVVVNNVGVAGLDYTLNIANSLGDRNAVLARPSLIATDGASSRFFSGLNVNAAAVGGGSYSAVLQIEKDIGVELNVLPHFLDDGRVRLAISAERSALALHDSASIGFELRIDTHRTLVEAEVVANLGETIILSGLVDQEQEEFSTGIPVIQKIPLLRLFGSQRSGFDLKRSVMILITPRSPDEGSIAGNVPPDDAHAQTAMEALRALHPSWFDVESRSAAVLRELPLAEYHRFFRTGDLRRRPVDRVDPVLERLRQLLWHPHADAMEP